MINHPDTDLAAPALNTSGVPWHTLYYQANYPRLQQIKARWDPRNVFHHALSNTSHPRADGSTLAVEPGPRMPLGLPRQQHMIVGQRLGYTAGHCDDIQRRSGSDPLAWGDNHYRAQLRNALRVRNFRPDDATELE